MNKRHVNVVCAINKKDDKYLSVKRSDKGEVGLKWEFPGGKIEPGESMEEAIVREIKEELNCNIRVIKYLGSVYHEYETFNITLNGLLCEMIDNHLELREHVDICWVDKVELVKFNFAGADLKLIKAIEL